MDRDFGCPNPDPLKKTLVIYSNCHGSFIHRMFTTNSDIVKDYNIYLILCYVYKTGKDPQNFSHLLKLADIFLYQLVYKNDSKLSTFEENENSILKRLKTPCQLVCFANPQNDAIFLAKHPDLSEYVKQNNIKTIMNANFSYLQQRIFEKTTRIFLEKDQTCDVKIFDFIIFNISKQRIFVDKYHPTSIVLLEITKRLIEFFPKKYSFDIHQFPDNIMNFTEAGPNSSVDATFYKMEFISPEESNIGNVQLQNRINDIWEQDQFKKEFDLVKDYAISVWE
tara:strand:+ start:924 stop:1763 length:840 start_codon:yes stop_codon:yes gene_type:complete